MSADVIHVTWDDATRAVFERRLAPLDPAGREEALRLMGLGLHMTGRSDDARPLLERAVTVPGADPHPGAYEALAQIAASRGDREGAIYRFQELLAEYPEGEGTTGGVEVALAELLLERAGEGDVDRAVELLSTWRRRRPLTLDTLLFRWHVALIRSAEAVGDDRTARTAATTALNLAESAKRLSFHPDFHRIDADRSTMQWLKALAA
ncbi:tetratricopeptide repeat protein [Demequina iriomotensis]|uniref:tetratricopeptide repeat protein n=1 Tax=Demequina iriomotensis TaxID=1536641 RepID=UPI000784A532|nr:tetratricopeptide repeat protein [Demequina iriomotensis]